MVLGLQKAEPQAEGCAERSAPVGSPAMLRPQPSWGRGLPLGAGGGVLREAGKQVGPFDGQATSPTPSGAQETGFPGSQPKPSSKDSLDAVGLTEQPPRPLSAHSLIRQGRSPQSTSLNREDDLFW